jgi:molybdopterin converting factor small subunit
MARVRLLGPARDAAGTGSADVAGATVGAVVDEAIARYGPELAAVVAHSALWLNGAPAGRGTPVTDTDEIAVLPPVSGG